MVLLILNTGIPLITCDQPVINLYADYNNLSEQGDELIFYYPIYP